MSVFTPVSQQTATELLRHYCLGTLEGLEGIATGTDNTNYFLHTSHGPYVLTLFERLGADELAFYVNLLAHLAQHGIPCPAPIASRENRYIQRVEGRPAVIVSRLPGASVDAPDVQQCRLVGAMLADTHIAAQSFGGRLPLPHGPRWLREAGQRIARHIDGYDLALLKDEQRHQARERTEDVPRGVIHGDLFRDNVLFHDGRLSGILDYWFAGSDALLFDVAVAVNDWCVDPAGELDPARVQALLGGYHAARPFVAIEERQWPLMLRAAALRFWASRLLDVHLPRPGELRQVKDPAHFRRILELRVAAGTQAPWLG